MSALSNLGNGSGYIYITDKDNVIISNLANTADNKQLIISEAVYNGALANESGSIFTGNYNRYYINADSSASSGTISGAVEITNYITGFNLGNTMPHVDVTAAAGVITYTRYSNIQRIVVDTQSSAATDDILYIRETNSYIADGDILILVGAHDERVSTFIDCLSNGGQDAKKANAGVALSGIGQLSLDSTTSFETLDENYVLMMYYCEATTKWHEINRAPNAVITDRKLRDNDINVPIKGSKVISSITAGDVTTPQAGITEGTILVTGTHSIGSGTFTIDKPSGGVAKEGEKMIAVWNANLTTSGAVNVFGQTLTTDQMLNGTTKPMEIITHYVNGAWQDGIISRSDDASEDALGNPSSDGMVLTSTAAGVRSWAKREKVIHTVSATYDTASMAKTVADTPVVIAVDAFPTGSLIMCDEAIIEMETALTSGSSADVSIGVNGGGISQDLDAIHDETDYNAAPFNSATAVTRTSPGGSVTILKPASGPCNIEVNVTAADLTGGKFTVTVPYMTS
tara:strand:+ start:21086 stop:22627 length:1542 start_codon:yes stop_codon:yes gene_type:complete